MLQIKSDPRLKWFYRVILVYILLMCIATCRECYAMNVEAEILNAVDVYVQEITVNPTDIGCELAHRNLESRIDFLLFFHETSIRKELMPTEKKQFKKGEKS